MKRSKPVFIITFCLWFLRHRNDRALHHVHHHQPCSLCTWFSMQGFLTGKTQTNSRLDDHCGRVVTKDPFEETHST